MGVGVGVRVWGVWVWSCVHVVCVWQQMDQATRLLCTEWVADGFADGLQIIRGPRESLPMQHVDQGTPNHTRGVPPPPPPPPPHTRTHAHTHIHRLDKWTARASVELTGQLQIFGCVFTTYAATVASASAVLICWCPITPAAVDSSARTTLVCPDAAASIRACGTTSRRIAVDRHAVSQTKHV